MIVLQNEIPSRERADIYHERNVSKTKCHPREDMGEGDMGGGGHGGPGQRGVNDNFPLILHSAGRTFEAIKVFYGHVSGVSRRGGVPP